MFVSNLKAFILNILDYFFENGNDHRSFGKAIVL